MITLDYALSDEWSRQDAQDDLATADRMALRYQHFLGDIVWLIESDDLSARWGWVPTLDFALAIVKTIKDLEVGRSSRFEFTESEATILFVARDGLVSITPSYVSARPTVDLGVFSDVAHDFLTRVCAGLVGRFPALQMNPSFLELAKEGFSLSE